MSTDKNTINNWFKTGLKPTQAQFWATWDSFWHKDEKIPISSINNLGGLLDGKAEANHTHTDYATNDAISLTAENVTAWQQKLGVADLKFDDQAITITQDYTDFGLVAGDSINAFNNAIYSEVAKKFDAPTENATNGYVLMADGSTVPKSDFGKVDKVMGVAPDANKNVDFSGVALNWTHAQHRMSALVSKHNDATFNRLLGMDAQGNINEVGLPAMTNEILKSSDAQKDSWRLASLKTNETFTNGKPIISLFAKTYIDKTLPYKQNFSLLGSNLYVNPSLSTLKMIQIKDESGNIITPIEHVISDFSVYYSQTSVLSFFYDFSVLPKGSYAFRLTNQLGLTSDLSREFTITETSVQNPVNITWDYIGEVGKESTDYLVTTTSVTITNLPIWGGGVEANKRNCAYKTDTFITEELVLSGFILEFNGTTTGNYFGGSLPSIVEITRLDDVVLFGLQFSKTGGTPNITSILPTNSEIYTGIPTMNISMTQKINIIYKDGVVEIIGLGDNGVYFYSRVYLIDFPISNLRLKVRLGGSEQSNTQVLSKGIVFTNLSKL